MSPRSLSASLHPAAPGSPSGRPEHIVIRHCVRVRWVVAVCGLLVAVSGMAAAGEGPFPYPFSVDEDALAGAAPDQSALNRPLGLADRLTVQGRHFRRAGPDGIPGTKDDERVRLWGVNLSFEANFPPPEEARRIALRLRRLGFNAVRLHHLDTQLGRTGDQPRGILTTGPYPSFDKVAVARLAHFIRVLAQEGIYTNLNLHVGYVFRPDVDGVPPYSTAAMVRPIATPIVVYSPPLRERQEAYARALIRQLGLRDDPALAMVEINNESSLLAAWSRREWNDAVAPAYRPELERRWQDWLNTRYGSVAAACRAWRTCVGADTAPLLTPDDVGPPREGAGSLGEKLVMRLRGLSARAFGSADPVADATGDGRALRARDFVSFLAAVDREYLDRMAAVVREEAGTQVPVAGTQMAYGGVLNLTSHAGMSYIDEHFYVDHPHFPHGQRDQRDWRIWDVALTGNQMPRLLALGFMRDLRKPYVVSEYNQPFPSRQGAQIMPLVAAVARLQDWDGLFFFDYANAAEWSDAPSNFTLRGDWGKYVGAGQAAWLFRTDELAALPEEVAIPLSSASQAAIAGSSDPKALASHLHARWQVTPELAWRARIGIDTSASSVPQTNLAPLAQSAPLGHEAAGYASLRTSHALGLFGQTDAPHFGRDDGLQVEMRGAAPYRAAVLLTALDGRPVDASRHLLLTWGSHTIGTQPGSRPPRPKNWVPHPSGANSWTLEPDPDHLDRPSGARRTTAPAWLEGRPVRLSWPFRQRPTVYPLDGMGRRLPALHAGNIRLDEGRATIDLFGPGTPPAPWYELVVDDATISSTPAP